MILIQKRDGGDITIVEMPDGKVYVNPPHRREAEIPRHFHRYEDYGLNDNFLRCTKCGRVSRQLTIDDI